MIRRIIAVALVAVSVAPSLLLAARVEEVRVERRGGGLIEDAAVFAFTSVKAGDELVRAALSRDVRALEQSGRFAYVATEVETVPGGVAVTYVVTSKPRIRLIRVEGADDIGNAKVRELLELGPGDLVDDAMLAFKAVKVREHYQKKYYPAAELKWKIVENERSGTADVFVTVREGRRAKISKILFTGDIPDPGRTRRALRALFPWFSERPPVIAHDLRRAMKQRQVNMWSWITGAGTYKPEELDGDTELIRRALMERGYLDAAIGEPAVDASSGKRLVVRIPVDEGSQYRLGRIEVKGPEKFPLADVSRSITNRAGDLASVAAIDRAQQAVRDFYGSRGYIRSEVQSQLEPHAGEPVVDVNIAVKSEGEQAVVRDVIIRGNTRTKDKVIRREVTALPGEPYNQVKVRTSEARLRNLGYFNFVAAVPEDTPRADQFDLALEVEEQRTGQFLIGAGFSSVDDLIGFVELSQGNFDLFNWPPTGGGQKLRLRGTAGTKRNDLELSFTEPWFLDRKLALSVDLYRRNRSYFSSMYDQRNTGGSLGLGFPLTPFTRLNLTYGLEEIKIHDMDTNASPFFLSQAGTYTKSWVDATVLRDSRDSSFIPTRGTRSSLGVMWAGGPLAGDVDVYSLEAQSSTFLPIWFDHVLNLRVWSSVVDTHGDAEDVPIFERLFLGGARTLRGFKYRDVGPKDENDEPIGGKTAWSATAEYTIPIFERLRFATFYDIGYVYEDAYDWELSDYNSDWGVGLRLDFPGFPLRLDYAWPLETDPSDGRKSGRFQFTIGYSY
ncbi:MAG: outer membrane protein assembly factor BamA [Verrucomicrobia bacterium]|nr:outer membrane protein assembly factor BamA [Verrucomicrobiota bacterium]